MPPVLSTMVPRPFDMSPFANNFAVKCSKNLASYMPVAQMRAFDAGESTVRRLDDEAFDAKRQWYKARQALLEEKKHQQERALDAGRTFESIFKQYHGQYVRLPKEAKKNVLSWTDLIKTEEWKKLMGKSGRTVSWYREFAKGFLDYDLFWGKTKLQKPKNLKTAWQMFKDHRDGKKDPSKKKRRRKHNPSGKGRYLKPAIKKFNKKYEWTGDKAKACDFCHKMTNDADLPGLKCRGCGLIVHACCKTVCKEDQTTCVGCIKRTKMFFECSTDELRTWNNCGYFERKGAFLAYKGPKVRPGQGLKTDYLWLKIPDYVVDVINNAEEPNASDNQAAAVGQVDEYADIFKPAKNVEHRNRFGEQTEVAAGASNVVEAEADASSIAEEVADASSIAEAVADASSRVEAAVANAEAVDGARQNVLENHNGIPQEPVIDEVEDRHSSHIAFLKAAGVDEDKLLRLDAWRSEARKLQESVDLEEMSSIHTDLNRSSYWWEGSKLRGCTDFFLKNGLNMHMRRYIGYVCKLHSKRAFSALYPLVFGCTTTDSVGRRQAKSKLLQMFIDFDLKQKKEEDAEEERQRQKRAEEQVVTDADIESHFDVDSDDVDAGAPGDDEEEKKENDEDASHTQETSERARREQKQTNHQRANNI